MSEKIAKDLIDVHEKLRANRLTWEQHWQEAAELCLPRQDEFFQSQRTPGEKRTDRIIDSIGVVGAQRFASAVEGVTMPRSQRWHTLSPTDNSLKRNLDVRAFLDETTDLLFRLRYSSKSSFATQSHEVLMSLGVFGTGALFIKDVPGVGPQYKSIHIGSLFLRENSSGQIDWVQREYKLDQRQAFQMFGDRTPAKIKEAKDPTEKFLFMHCVKPNDGLDMGRKDAKGMAFASYDVFVEGKEIVAEGGFHTFPYAIARYVTAPSETYGRSPAMQVLSDIKMAQEMKRSILRAAHKLTDPPLLLHDDGRLSRFSTKPNALNMGGIDANGRQMVQALNTGGRPDFGDELLQQVHKTINDAFLVTLFQILVETPEMTATEVLHRAQEKGALLSPTMGRLENEFLGPLIEREIDVANRNGFLPDIPDELGGELEFDVEYTSPLSRQQRAESALGAEHLMQQALAVAGIAPEVFDKIDLDRYLDIQAEALGAPALMLRDGEDVARIREAREQQQQLMQLSEQAPKVAGAVESLAKAEALQ